MEERKMNVINQKQSSQVTVSDEVVAIIADLTISDVKGVSTYGGRKGKKNYGKGIGIRMDGRDVYVDISLVLEAGAKVKNVAVPIQQKVKTSIENMLDMNVKEVNVCVIGIQKNEASE